VTTTIEEAQMETTLQIDFQGMEPQESLRAEIARHVAALEKRYGRITACRVAVKDPGQHHRTSGLFEVHIHLVLPDRKEVNVGHKPDADQRHADVRSAINDAFKHALRVLEEDVHRMDGRVKAHEPRPSPETSD
jgi:ribosome-associated translation inhibitor RaiA